MSSLLSTLTGPADVKSLPRGKLQVLCQEIRERIIEVMADNGGHLASSLGATEICVALHKVFDCPDDKFVWDVGHQAYGHKLLTGRNSEFGSIRQYQGLSGFPSPEESSHDHFHAGHAGVALSQALGMAKARDLEGGNYHVLPIIGDATLTCGTALEALNNMSRKLKRFIVLLNDNNMSISKNVGAITRILSRILNHPTSNKLYHELEQLVSKIPGYGSFLAKQGQKLTESVKNLVSPAVFFEHYGLSYVGPVDGHDVEKLVDVLEQVKEASWPILLHVHTTKGHGLKEATKDPVVWHGATPFDPKTCKFIPNPSPKPTFPKIFGQHLIKMAEKDPSLVVVSPAMLKGSALEPFEEKFPERCFDVGIAESHCITFSGGLGKTGTQTVFCSIYSTFLQRGMDNLFHDVCLQEIPVIFAIDRAGIATGDGITHHGIYDLGFLREMPNLVICQPRNGQILKELMESAPSWKVPTAIRYPNMKTSLIDAPVKKRNIGKGEILAKGKDVAIIALGHMVHPALEAAKLLEDEGISVSVIDPIFVSPLDKNLIVEAAKKHKALFTLEEHALEGGFGAAVNQLLMAHSPLPVKVRNLGLPRKFFPQGSLVDFMKEFGLTPEKIKEAIQNEFAAKEEIINYEALDYAETP